MHIWKTESNQIVMKCQLHNMLLYMFRTISRNAYISHVAAIKIKIPLREGTTMFNIYVTCIVAWLSDSIGYLNQAGARNDNVNSIYIYKFYTVFYQIFL